MKRCKNCGKILIKDANFCPNCGKPFGTGKLEEKKNKEIQKRYSCIHCGAEYGSFSCVCPICKKEQTGTIKSEIVLDLIHSLSKAEDRSSYESKEEIIRSFVLPENKEDLFYFIDYASRCVDVNVLTAKNARKAGLNRTEFERQRMLSLAWYQRLQEAYRKYKPLYEMAPDFYVVDRLYRSVDRGLQTSSTTYKDRKQSLRIKRIIGSVESLAFIAVVALIIGGLGYFFKVYLDAYEPRNLLAGTEFSNQSQDYETIEGEAELYNEETTYYDALRIIEDNTVQKPFVEGRDYLVALGITPTYFHSHTNELFDGTIKSKSDEELYDEQWIITKVDHYDKDQKRIICYVDNTENRKRLIEIEESVDEKVTGGEDKETDYVSIMVWVTETGECYHNKPNCGRTKSAYQVTIDQAYSMGKRQCSKCY